MKKGKHPVTGGRGPFISLRSAPSSWCGMPAMSSVDCKSMPRGERRDLDHAGGKECCLRAISQLSSCALPSSARELVFTDHLLVLGASIHEALLASVEK